MGAILAESRICIEMGLSCDSSRFYRNCKNHKEAGLLVHKKAENRVIFPLWAKNSLIFAGHGLQ